MQAVGDGRVHPHEPVLLNVTGNGNLLARRDHTLHPIEPSLHITPDQVTPAHVQSLASYFAE